MRVRVTQSKRFVRWLLLLAIIAAPIVFFGAKNAVLAATCADTYVATRDGDASQSTVIPTFFCPGGQPPYTGGSTSRGNAANPNAITLNSNLLTSGNSGNGTPGNPLKVFPGQYITMALHYEPDKRGNDVFAWINFASAKFDLDYQVDQTESGNPGTHSDSYVAAGEGTVEGCPEFWVGPQSPFLGGYGDYGKQAGDYHSVGGSPAGHTGCSGNDRMAAIWKNAGEQVRPGGYTYRVQVRIRSDATPTTGPDPEDRRFCIDGRVASTVTSAGGTSFATGPNNIANVKASTNEYCFTIPADPVINVNTYVDGVLSDSAPTPKIRYNNSTSCVSSAATADMTQESNDGPGHYDVGANFGSNYCLNFPSNSTYNLDYVSPPSTGSQVAGVNCRTQALTSYGVNCGTGNLADNATDTYNVYYRTGGGHTIQGRLIDSVGGEGIMLPPGPSVQIFSDKQGSACNTGTPLSQMGTDEDGNYTTFLPTGKHYCVVPPGPFTGVDPYPYNYHYRNPNPSSYTGQVAGLDCRSYGDTSDQGIKCTGWATADADGSHIGAEEVEVQQDAHVCGSRSASDANAHFNGSTHSDNVVENYENDTESNGSYAVNQKCVESETQIGGEQLKECIGGSQKAYGENYNGDDFKRCNQYKAGWVDVQQLENNANGRCDGLYDEDYGDDKTDYPSDERCVNTVGTPVNGPYVQDDKCSDHPTLPTAFGVGGGGYSIDERCDADNVCTTVGSTTTCTWKRKKVTRPVTHSSWRGTEWRHTVWRVDKTVYKRPFLVYPSDLPSDIGLDVRYDPYIDVSGRIYNSTTDPDHGYADIIDRCAAGDINADPNGNFSFQIKRRDAFCVQQNTARYYDDPYSSVAVDGPFLNETWASKINRTTNAYDFQVGGSDVHLGGLDFQFTNPILGLAKSVNTNGEQVPATECVAAGSSCVKPGQELEYSIRGTNTGDATSGYMLEDFLPHNIEPSSVQITSLKINDIEVGCNGVSCGFAVSGGVANGATQSAYDGGAANNPSTPPSIFVRIDSLAAGAKIDLVWKGRVRSADTVGVFPGNYSYCDVPGNWSNRGNTSTRTDDATSCEDYSLNGRQSVVNYARSSYHWGTSYPSNGFSGWGKTATQADDGRGGKVSNLVINPIPGAMTCIGKNADAQIDTGNTVPLVDYGCGLTGPNRTLSHYIYAKPNTTSTGVATTVNFNINVDRQADRGPVNYTVYDQAGAGASATDLDTAFEMPTGVVASPYMDPAFTTSGRKVYLQDRNSYANQSASRQQFDMSVAANNNRSDGEDAGNSTKVCWPRYWETGHPVSCIGPASITLRQVGGAFPYYQTFQGDVQSTGGFGQGIVCGNNPGNQGFNNNNGSVTTGDYFVTTSGIIVNRVLSAAHGDAIKKYGQCRPNIAANIEKNAAALSARSGTLKTVNGNCTIGATAAADQCAGTVTMDGRKTYYIKGNLFILRDLPYLPNTNFSNAPSIGFVVTGNIYIGKDVRRLDGYYVAGTTGAAADNSATQNGSVYTCYGKSSNGTPSTLGPDPLGMLNVNDCVNPLTINGLLQARKIYFNRTYNSAAAETVRFDPRIYLLTPPGFSSIGGDTSSQPSSGVELQPRY